MIEQLLIPLFSTAITLFVVLVDRWIRQRDEMQKNRKGMLSELEYNLVVSNQAKDWINRYKKDSIINKIPTFSIPRYQTSTFDFLINTGFINDLGEDYPAKIKIIYMYIKMCNEHFDRIDRLRYESFDIVEVKEYLNTLTQITDEMMSIIESEISNYISYFK